MTKREKTGYVKALLFASMSIIGMDANAFDFEGIRYGVLSESDKTVYVDRPIANEQFTGNVVIPSQVSYEGKEYTVTQISYKAFYECEELTSIRLPDCISEIDNWAFTRCYQLKNINIPKNLQRLGEYALFWCSSIEDLTLPNTLTDIGKSALLGLMGLRSLTVEEGNPEYLCEDGILFNHNKTTLMLMPAQSGKTHYDIPATVTTIMPSAFSGCQLKSITLPPDLTEIGSSALSGLSQLETITIPAFVTSIGFAAFTGCSSLKEVDVPSSVHSIDKAAFSECTSLVKFRLPEGLTRIEGWLFDGCANLSEVNLPASVNYIGTAAFRNCSSLPTFQIPQEVTIIDQEAFEGCLLPNELIIPDKVEKVGWDAFRGCSGLEEITIGRSVRILAGGTFHGCDNIWEVWSYIEEPFDVIDYEDSHDDYILLGKCFPNAVTSKSILHVPEGTTEKYLSKRGWRDFFLIVEMEPDEVTPLPINHSIESACYSIDGRRLKEAPSHGLYIRNGKKLYTK